MKAHKFAEYFPKMSKEEFEALKDNIKQNGLIDPIVVFEGQVLDGRHRYKACKELEIPIRRKEFKGKDALAYVISRNSIRRHLNQSQKACTAILAYSDETLGTRTLSKLFGVSRTYVQAAKALHEEDLDKFQSVLNGKGSLKIQEGDVKKEKKEGWKDLVDKDMVIAADVKQKFLKEKIKTAKGLDSTHLINYVMSYKFKKGDRLINVQRIDRALKLLKHFCGDYRKAAKKKFSDEEIVANLLTRLEI